MANRAILAAALALAGCNQGAEDSGTYTLYRTSVAADLRIHIATFDSADGEAYNQENCFLAASLFAGQPGVAVKFWCEKGRFRS